MTNHYLKLPYTLFKVEGPDAAKFLQGQASCDIDSLADNTWTFGTANSPKGRMYWLFVIARIDGAFWIKVHNDIAESGIHALNKYKVFFKCEFKQQHDYAVYGIRSVFKHSGNSITQETNGYLRAADRSEQRCELWSREALEANSSDAELEAWLQDDCYHGIPELYPQTLDTFILQQLNLQELGAVSFNKGCYTGQEIIARMKFLGKLKKKMYLFNLDAKETAALLPGSKLVNAEGRKIGDVVRFHAGRDKFVGLVVCDIAFAESGQPALLAEGSNTPIRIEEIDYN
ncbi:hypothetical protein A3765_09550 [Oleiphilus sp. HI0130]|uniref:CAF17-like 4Fe-4S cluster assembly/insertion protein YgfZ n=1 Tax=Oleiphilus sp. HI0079 TaxID=1822254 RepID=UPI0007C2585E|nr:folate-binding protein YgfZ [Oleiphilus sp. HI0079]KZZ13590.1 hypothetical protein A3750_03370 [Oleiphilus sp. HI0079]KZZ76921.1 hypothetical protein A3765_09550 [Oleiphilus sp. HI0130]